MWRRASGHLLNDIRHQRGFEVEAKVRDVLDLLQEKGYIYSHWQANDHEDRFEGVDHHFLNNSGEEIEFQIKSSETGLRKAKEKYPSVRVFVTNSGDTSAEIEKKFINEFKLVRRDV